MPTPSRGIPIQLDKERRLRYPLGELKGLDGDQDVATLIWLGLKHEDGALTVEQVGEMVDLEMLPSLIEPLKKASAGAIDLSKILGPDTAGKDEAATTTTTETAPTSS